MKTCVSKNKSVRFRYIHCTYIYFAINHILSLFQMKAFSNNMFISSSYDQTVKGWNADDIKDVMILKGTLYKKCTNRQIQSNVSPPLSSNLY